MPMLDPIALTAPMRHVAPYRPLGRAVGLVAAVAFASIGFSLEARADLRLCNDTAGRLGVAVGYQDGKGWATEGWWTIPAQSCETLLKGRLAGRYYYVHAVDYDRGGEWAGKTQMCTADASFTIKGNAECEVRGHRRAGFLEVDTNDAKDWTIRLADPVETPKAK